MRINKDLLKHYFYKMMNSEKFKNKDHLNKRQNTNNAPKEEQKNDPKHPAKAEENPLIDMLESSLRNMTHAEHDLLLEFVNILKSRGKLSNKFIFLILDK